MPDSIVLETSQGTRLDNSRKGEITLWDKSFHDTLERQYGSSSRERTPPTVTYNCHGLTFAVRRTGIHQEAVLKTVMADDVYVEIERGKVLPGDTIIYYGEDGDIIHSGIVVEEPNADNLWSALVVSKWCKYKELVHHATQCPYGAGYQKFYRTYGA
jgi:hypothetical protein